MEQLEKAIQDTTKLQQAGQSVQAKMQLTNALTQIEQQAQVRRSEAKRSDSSSERKSVARTEFGKSA